MKRAGCTYLLPLLILIGIMLASAAGTNLRAAERPLVIALVSQQSEQYLQVLESCEKEVVKQFPEVTMVRYFLQKKPEENMQVLRQINERKPFLLLTLGSRATRAGLDSVPDVPIVASMILDDRVLGRSPRATGVMLSFPPEVHIQWLRRFLPGVDRAVILYNPQENSHWIDGITKTAKQLDIEIEAIPVESVKQLPAALKALCRKGNVLLGLPDDTVYSGTTAEAVLLSTFRNRIPFAGLSPSWVKAGALYSLGWDYMDLGRQCGTIAGKILAGTPVADIAPVSPEKVRYEVNLKTADHLRLTIDPGLIQGATVVHR